MIYRTLGRTGLQVSVLGLGTVKLGRNQGVKYPAGFDLPDDRQAARLLDTARELGINLLDTAPAYGESERRLGELLGPHRQSWILCTKVGEYFEQGSSRWDFTPEATRASVTASLQRLRTEYLDIVLIHSDGSDCEILESLGTLDALRALKGEGLIRAVGISHKSVEGGDCAIKAGCDVIMATLNLLETGQLPVIARAATAGCGVLVKKALASGHAGGDSLRFAAATAGVSAVIVGTLSAGHLRENVTELDGLTV
ncbi:MAG: aldo/keto reductase [Pseudomonadales bacterium]